jgi:carboxymethylenebutenolidase
MKELHINIPTRAGSVDTFICHPERGGPRPGIVFYMDAPGIREELYDMARRLATVGYYVVLPNLYYRHGHGTTCAPDCTDESTSSFKRMVELMLTLTNDMIAEDSEALLAFLDKQPEIRNGPLGCVGYCMSGPFALTAAARFPERFAALATFHGVPMVTDKPDSPHLAAARVRAESYHGFGELDPLVPGKDVDAFRAALAETAGRYEIELYGGAGHGFTFPQRAGYHKAQAERHWERLFDLFRRNLG